MKMRIKIIGSKCSNGMKLIKMVQKAVKKFEGSINLELQDQNNKVKNIPGLIINDTLVSEGKVLSEREIIKFMNEFINC